LLAGARLEAGVQLGIAGESRLDGRRLVLSVELRNTGDVAASRLRVEGELAGARAEGRAEQLAPGARHVFELSYGSDASRPGTYAVPLWIDFKEGSEPTAPLRHELGYLQVPLGARPVPALRVSLQPRPLDVLGDLVVDLESADGAPHRADVRVVVPAGINLLDGPAEVAVPASGRASVRLRVIRAGAAPGTGVAVLAIAGTLDGPLQRDAVASASLPLRPRAPWLPRLRPFLLALAGILLLLATLVEWRAARRRRGAHGASREPSNAGPDAGANVP